MALKNAKQNGFSSLIAVLLPPVMFAALLFFIRRYPPFTWLNEPGLFPWQLWVMMGSGGFATIAGILDWRYHRRENVVVGRQEHNCELLALVIGAGPLFGLMLAASATAHPAALLLPVIVTLLITVCLICYDEFRFHLKRCGKYETALHRTLVFGNGIAWLSWFHWCFVKGGSFAI